MDRRDLERLLALNVDMRLQEEQIWKLELEIASVQAQKMSNEPRGSNRITTEDKIAKLVDMKTELDKTWDTSIDLKCNIVKRVNRIRSPIYRVLLRGFYMLDMPTEQLAHKIGYSSQHTYRLISDAIRAFEDVKDEKNERTVCDKVYTEKT